jgi:DNA-binding transcriptional MerR regulator
MTVEIPDKLYFKIGEVAALLDVKTHVLRYWETEFSILQPVKSRSNQRLYRRKDVETALLIKDMLYRQGFTIAGARKKLRKQSNLASPPHPPTDTPCQLLKEVRRDLLKIRQRLISAQPEK